MAILLFITGLLFLIAGAEALVRGASRLASDFGISPLVIGLTVVAFGTSSPELAVSVKSALSGQAGIALGNVIGSNIFNVLFILGLSALIVPLVVAQQLVRLDVPLMIALSVIVLFLSLDEHLGRADGFLLVTGLVIYVCFLVFQSRRESRQVKEEYAREFATEHELVLLLKGVPTVIATPDGHAYVNATGNAGLAKGGSGDVLTGLIAGLIAQGMPPCEAAACGTWLHGRAADALQASSCSRTMMPAELVDAFPSAFRI